MEKYSYWRDPGSGIHPFLFLKPPRSDPNFIIKYASTAVRAVLAAAKFVLIILLALLYQILDFAFEILYFDYPKYWVKLVLLGFIARAILFITGFFYINIENNAKGKTRSTRSGGFNLIIANHSSYIDYIYFQYRYNPVFLKVGLDGQVTPHSMFSGIFGVTEIIKAGEVSLEDYIDSYNSIRPVVLFPEGTTTNGRGILEWSIDLSSELGESLPSNIDVDMIGVRYMWKNFCVCFTTGTVLSHFWGLLLQMYNVIQIKQTLSISMPCAQLPVALATAVRLRRVAKNAEAKTEFLKYFNERESKDFYKKKKNA